ncbi:6-phosphogluconolactonase [Candidatus Puniceispirillum sp.]|nr:6-phosphogluconolactonase [Candidatus Puniceispirillum sp.]
MSVVNQIASALSIAIDERGTASFVVSGGSSPTSVFAALVAGEHHHDIDWERVIITLVDDRQVADDHDDSNCKLIRSKLLQGPVGAAQFLPLTVEGAVSEIPRPFDVMLLGMGSDGHFASLFPSMVDDRAMDVSTPPAVIKTEPHGDPVWPRISMNLSMILQSRLILLLVKGSLKRETLAAAQIDRSLPVHHLITQNMKAVQIVED